MQIVNNGAGDRRVRMAIATAFADARYPGDDRIVNPDAPNHMHCQECREIAADFRGKDWRDVTLDALRPRHQETIILLAPAAFCYYLPAYMLAAMDHEHADLIPGVVVRLLMPCFDVIERDAFFIERAKLLSDPQAAAVRVFLEFMRDACPNEWHADEPRVALRRYWGRFQW